jgi:tripartite-type tricarboxylate transporter receptor subunit TctC
MAQWQPDRPINIIVPWSAGGSTDQVTRVVAPLLEEALGTEVVVVNQPGASGSIGTAAALAAPRDGYTWTANAIANNATYSITGLVEDTSIEDYVVYLHVANVPVVSVNVDSPYQDFGELLDAMKGGWRDGRHGRRELVRRHGSGRHSTKLPAKS